MVLRGCDDDPARRTRAHRASRKDKEKYKRAGSRLGFEDARAGSGGHAPRGIPRTLARLAPACLNLPCARFKSKRRSPSFAEAAQPWRFWPMRSPTRSTRDFAPALFPPVCGSNDVWAGATLSSAMPVDLHPLVTSPSQLAIYQFSAQDRNAPRIENRQWYRRADFAHGVRLTRRSGMCELSGILG